MKRYIEEHQTVDLGFDVKPIFRVDVKKLQDWYNDLQENYKDWKFIVGENHHVWQFPISDPTGKTGHIIPDETGYYTLCWNSDEEGPKPFEQGCAKPEYKDNDNDELNPRKCFTGYGLDVVKSLPFRSKKWLVTEHVTGTKLITHQDSPDKIRVHIPIHTNKDSNWIINGKEYYMEPGWAYLVNTTLPHSVENKGTTDRVHLYGKVWTEDVKAWLM
tara:strand:+ start:6007 stop:6654 length:648 start_codon:yes stop_codon:yes gene_type:complete